MIFQVVLSSINLTIVFFLPKTLLELELLLTLKPAASLSSVRIVQMMAAELETGRAVSKPQMSKRWRNDIIPFH